MKAIKRYFKRLHARIKDNRAVFILYTVLRILVFATLIRSLIIGNYESAGVCLLTLALFLIPSFLEGALRMKISPLFEGIIYVFIFAAEILGELAHYFTRVPIWDTLLHTTSGFLYAAVGFVKIDLLNRNDKNVKLSPIYLTLVAFCFSMTIGVLWEFLECGADLFLGADMQKDFIIQSFQSTKMDPTQTQQAFKVIDVIKTQIYTASGQVHEIDGGYLDIGILDTMKDLFVNFIGAVVFCIFGFIYVRSEGKKKVSAKIVEGMRLQPATEEQQQAWEKAADEPTRIENAAEKAKERAKEKAQNKKNSKKD